MTLDDVSLSPGAQARFGGLEIDDKPPAHAPAPQALPAPQAAPPALHDDDGISRASLERIDAQVVAARAIGLQGLTGTRADGLLYDPGTRAMAPSVKASREAWEKWPTLEIGGGALIDEIKAEDRQDTKNVPAPELRMTSAGALYRTTHDASKALPIHANALENLAGRLEIRGGSSYLPHSIPAEWRAKLLNEVHFPQAFREDKRATDKARELDAAAPAVVVPRELTIRTRKRAGDGFGGRRGIWGVTGPRYSTAADGDAITRELIDCLPADGRVQIVYDGFRYRIDCFWHTPHDEIGVGEIFELGLRGAFADDGTRAINFDSVFYQARCRNLTRITHTKKGLNRRHVGKDLLELVKDAIGGINRDFQAFLPAWQAASLENVLERYNCDLPEEVFRGLVASKSVWIANVKPEEMVERLKRAWDLDPGYSKRAIINAVTRAAHENTWPSQWATDELEAQAGQLVYAKVWNVQLADEMATG